MLYLKIFVLVLAVVLNNINGCTSTLNSTTDVTHRPLILVGGISGSQSYSKNAMDYEDAKHEWVTAKNLLFSKGFAARFRLILNLATNKSSTITGQQFFPGYEKTWSLSYLGALFKVKTVPYFAALIERLRYIEFYKNNKHSIVAVPYDWRKGIAENEKFTAELKKMIEISYEMFDETKVIICAHSMGGLMTLNALHNMKEHWKEKYIHKAIFVGSPLGGSIKALKGILSGENFDIPVGINRKNYREMLSSFPASYTLFPRPEAFGDRVLLQVERDEGPLQITAKNIDTIFDITENKYGQRMYDIAKERFKSLGEPKGVDIECIYGTGVSTIEKVTYKRMPKPKKNRFIQEAPLAFKKGPKLEKRETGDGTVNLESLEVCRKWKRSRTHALEGADHLGSLSDDRFLDIMSFLTKVM